LFQKSNFLSSHSLWTDPTENTVPNSCSIFACVSVTVVTWFGFHGSVFTEPLPSNWLFLWLNICSFERICHNILAMVATLRSTCLNRLVCTHARTRELINRFG
jgi:hypothetical protein